MVGTYIELVPDAATLSLNRWPPSFSDA